jgi:hypothetical protein
LKELVQQVEACAAKDKILLFDASHCNPDAAQPQLSSGRMLAALQPEGAEAPLATTVAIASCRDQECGLPAEDRKHGLFALAVAEGLKGAADPDRNLHITADELYQFLETRLKNLPLEPGQTQSPARFGPAKPAP